MTTNTSRVRLPNLRSVTFLILTVTCQLTYAIEEGGTPPVPTGLSGPGVDADGAYTVSWNYSFGASYFQLQEKIGAGSWLTIYSGSSQSRAYSGKPANAYSYRVRACSTACSAYSSSLIVNVTGGIAPALTEGSVGAIGTTPYGIDVATDGDATVSVPLQLIPGVADFAPSLSLEYDSGRGIDRLEQSLPEDTLGYGWRLAGLSQIRRCVVNLASSASIQLNTSDSLCLDGMPLVLASGTHFAVGAIYRTLIESYIKIELKGTTGALWFAATMPDGTIHQYGNGGGSRVDKNGGADYQWSISQSTSTDNNTVSYSYYHNASNGINYITNINYANADVDFEYLARTDAQAVMIGSASQTQSAFLHTIRVEFRNKKVREYRLLDEVVNARRRLNKIQHCGYDEAGITATCLAPLDFDWWTPGAGEAVAGVPILMNGLMDGLFAVHQVEFGTITGSSHPFLFTERPFGNGVLPANTQLLSGTGVLRQVSTKLRRDNGLGGFHDTSYAYQDKGLKSTKHWGFLGFYAQRIKDEQSGIVSYAQYRMDYPYFGQLARLHQLDGVYPSHTRTLTRTERDLAKQSIVHTAGTSVYPYTSTSIDFIYEGTTQLGASKTSNTLTFANGFISAVVRTSQTGTGVSTGSPPGTWGDIPTYTLSGVLNTSESAITFTNRTTAGKWLINFPNAVTVESWPGAASGTGILQDVTQTPHVSSLRPAAITQYPNDAYLTLNNVFEYDNKGRVTSMTVSGDNVGSRMTDIPSFVEDRYPGQILNAKGQATTFSAYDLRFGAVKVKGHITGRNTSTDRDPFGRIKTSTNGDNVVTTTTYNDCPTGCGVFVYGVAPSYYVRTDSVVTPIRNTYYDSLGRVIRTEVQSFSGTSYSKQDVKYDTQGRIAKTSLPYFSGTPKDVIATYDIRDRIINVSRPDGSNTGTAYSVNGNTIVVTVTDNVKNANGTSAGVQVKRNEYNILGQLTKTIDGYGSTISASTTYSYDANGNALGVAIDGGSAGSTTTTFEYDAAGKQTKVVGPDIGTVTMTYTALGELSTTTDNKLQGTTRNYDVLGRLTSLVNIDGTSTWVWDTAANGVGKLHSRSNAGFTETFTYNSAGRLSKVVTGITPIGGSGSTNYTTSHTYDSNGRPLNTTYPGGFVLTRAYNANGYLSQLKSGAAAIQTISGMDAFGNSISESYANGVSTLRTFDPETGRLTDVNTTKGSTVLQNNDYAWRSNGTLESRIANPAIGLATTRKENFTYDVLNRVTLAETYIGSSNTRDLSYAYNELGNITSSTSTAVGDPDVTGYVYGAGVAGPHAVTSASINGVSRTLTYDLNGAVTKYDIAGTGDDKYIAYNASNQPRKIVIGSSLNDTTPVAKDEFAYDPNGGRYARKSTWQEGTGTVTEQVSYVGAVEIVVDNSTGVSQTITRTRLSPNVMHVKIVGTATEAFFEYAHRDHLGSIEAVTDGNGNVLDNLAFEAFGARKAKNWTGSIPSTELDALLALESGHSRKIRGFTGHEHLDRTGFIHMNGRVYDPVLGRFLSPDPIVQFPAFSQSWNRYSYLNNTPTSFTDPTGYFGNETMEEIVVTGSRGSNLGSSNSMLHAMGSLSVSNGGGIGSGGGRSEGGFGAGATTPTDTEAGESTDVDACLFNYVACDVTVSGSLYDSKVTVTASFSNQVNGIGQAIRSFRGITSRLSTSPLPASGLDAVSGDKLSDDKARKIGADTVFERALIAGGTGATVGAIIGATYAFAHLPAAFVAASAVNGGFLIAAAGIADIGVLAGVGAMTVGAPMFLLGIAVFGGYAIAYNYWIADGGE